MSAGYLVRLACVAFLLLALVATSEAASQCKAESGKTCTLTAQITIPPGTPPGDYQVCFTATSTAPALSSDPVCTTVTVTASGGIGGTTPVLTIGPLPAIGREMTFRGTFVGPITAATLIVRADGGAPVLARYIAVDATKKTWTAKVTGLVKGPHVLTVAWGVASATVSFSVPK